MFADDVEAASSSDHLALGTVVRYHQGYLVIQVDHLEEMPQIDQRVTVVAGWDEKQPPNTTGDTHG